MTDLQEIYQAAIDGRGDMLIVYEEYSQPVKMIDERTFELVDDPTEPGVVDDITGEIVREVFLKHGRVFLYLQEEIKDLGEIGVESALLTKRIRRMKTEELYQSILSKLGQMKDDETKLAQIYILLEQMMLILL